MSGLIDMHVHHYPEAARRDPVGWAAARKEGHWAQLVIDGPQGWADDQELLQALDDAAPGGRAVLQGWYWEHPETCREQNAFLLETVQRSHGRLAASVSVNPAAGADACRSLLEEAAARGASGIGELHPTAQRFTFTDPAWRAVCAFAREEDWPITLHVTEPVGHVYTGRLETPLEDYVAMAEAFPENRFILSHWGGGLPFFALNRRVGRALRNVWYDTAASPLLYSSKVWAMAVGGVGADRICFGSDFPLRLYPRRESVPAIRSLVDELMAANLPKPETGAIREANAATLFRFPDAEVSA